MVWSAKKVWENKQGIMIEFQEWVASSKDHQNHDQNFVCPDLFGHNLGPLKKKKICRLGKSTSMRAIDLAVQHTHFCRKMWNVVNLRFWWTFVVDIWLFLRNSACSFHWLSSSIFSCSSFVRPALQFAEVVMENGNWFPRPFWAKASLSLSKSLSFA